MPEDSLVKTTQNMMQKGNLGPSLQESILYGLGIALENAGSYSKALQFWHKANKLHQERSTFDFSQESARWRNLQLSFPDDCVQESSAQPQGEVQCLFVVGMPVSGKKLVEKILTAHQDADSLGDSDLLLSLAAETPEQYGLKNPYPFFLSEFSQENALNTGEKYIQRAKSFTEKDTSFLVSKAFRNALYIGFIRKILPGAKVIYCRRDPRDICLSCYTKKFPNILPLPSKLRDIGEYASHICSDNAILARNISRHDFGSFL